MTITYDSQKQRLFIALVRLGIAADSAAVIVEIAPRPKLYEVPGSIRSFAKELIRDHRMLRKRI